MRFGDHEWPRHVRALFLSDVHLGTRACQSNRLIDFLRHHDAEVIYLVGDIIDGWRLSASWYWPQTHADVIHALLQAARDGARIVYLPGNHDEFLRAYYGTHFGGIEVMEQAIHMGADGRRYLVVHGDCFDAMIMRARRLTALADRTNVATRAINQGVNRVRRGLGLSYWSFSQWAKARIKRAIRYTSGFEKALADVAHRSDADGVICGHIHHPTIHDHLGVRYINCGDWVESCTAVTEHVDGAFELVTWTGAVHDGVSERRAA